MIPLNYRYFAFELCASNLEDWAVSKYTGPIPRQSDGLHQLASGLCFLHEQERAHRDICPGNVLICPRGRRLIISDFGLCKSVRQNRHGREKWLAPERIENVHDFNDGEVIDSDTWAMGCVFHYFLTKGGHPFDGNNSLEMHKKIIEGNFTLESELSILLSYKQRT